VASLDAEDFAAREKAEAELARLGREAEPALRRLLDGSPSAESRRRARAVLAGVGVRLPSGAEVRPLRAAEVLERAGTTAAREFLRSQAAGSADAPLTASTKSALRRLGQ
jgi:hypothetical protein